MIRFLCLAFYVMALLNCSAFATEQSEAARHYQTGMEAWKAGEIDIAIAEWRFVLQLKPDSIPTKDKLIEALSRKVGLQEKELLAIKSPKQEESTSIEIMIDGRAIQTNSAVQIYQINDPSAYLAFVYDIEQMRRELMGTSLRIEDVEVELPIAIESWTRLLRQFDSVRGPISCQSFVQTYRCMITSCLNPITAIWQIVGGMSRKDSASLEQAKLQLQRLKYDPSIQVGMNNAVRNADAQLSALCSRLGIQKPFIIE